MRSRLTASAIVVALALLAAACGSDDSTPAPSDAYPRDSQLRLNHIQVLGSHNSYHIQAPPVLFAALKRISLELAQSLEYTHLPLDQQFDTQGIRQIELDVFDDPNGGLYARPRGLRVLTGDPNASIPELEVPGFKVLHVQDLDFLSTCKTFVECLRTINKWSDAHPGHVPMMILIEAKDDPLAGIGVTKPIPFDAAAFDALDAEIRSVLPPQKVITPDEVRGNHATLEEAIRTSGWPTLAAARGRVLFTLDNGDHYKADYIGGHPSLRGRILFASSEPGEPEAAFIKLNDPLGDYDHIREVVSQGFIVRTRSDADTLQARTGDTTMREAALSSGAQFVSTDYPVPNPAFGTGYQVAIPMGSPARCNPVSAPAGCTALDIENPRYLSAM
jgi:hypothetical protein